MEDFFATLNLSPTATKKEINTAFHLWKEKQSGTSDKLASMEIMRMTSIYKKIMLGSELKKSTFVETKFVKLADVSEIKDEPVKKVESVKKTEEIKKVDLQKKFKKVEHIEPVSNVVTLQHFEPRSFRKSRTAEKIEQNANKIISPMIATVAVIFGIILGNLLFTYAEQLELEKPVDPIEPYEFAEQIENPTVEEQNLSMHSQVAAMQVMFDFHNSITEKNYRRAYDSLTEECKSRIEFENWARNFKNIELSQVSNIEVAQELDDRIILTYNLQTEDHMNSVSNYVGTALLLKTVDGWKINEIVNLPK